MAKFSDRRIFNQLSRLGFTIWFNENNEKKETFGIRYINEFRNDFTNRFSNGTVRNSPPKIKHSGTFTLAESNSVAGGINIKNISGLQAEKSKEGGLYCFELKIPLEQKEKNLHSLSIPDDGKIKLCLEIGSLSEEERNKIKEKMPPRGQRRDSDRRRSEINKNPVTNLDGEEIWVTLKFASKDKI